MSRPDQEQRLRVCRFFYALVVEWFMRGTANPETRVRFPTRAPILPQKKLAFSTEVHYNINNKDLETQVIELKANCVLDPKTHLFKLSLEAGKEATFNVILTYDQYFALVKYLGGVAVAYQESLKGTNAKPKHKRLKKS